MSARATLGILVGVATLLVAGAAPAQTGGGSLVFLDHRNVPYVATADDVLVLGVSNEVPNASGLPRGPALWETSSDPDVFRLEVAAPASTGPVLRLDVCAGPPPLLPGSWSPGACRGLIEALPCLAVGEGRYRCPPLRLVTDVPDTSAATAEGQLLLAALGDHVVARRSDADGAFPTHAVVGRRDEMGVGRKVLRGHARVHILRLRPGGPPSVGGSEEAAIQLLREQIPLINERWAQCGVWYGAPEDLPIAIVDPPGPALLSVSDETGAEASGGEVRFRVDGRVIGPLHIAAGSSALATAERIAQAVRDAGFRVSVTPNPPVVGRPTGSADLLVRRPSGELAEITRIGYDRLTTDGTQSLSIGKVDLENGLDKFGNHNANSGTLEERTMFKALGDDDPATIEIFVVNFFAIHSGQAETFIEDDEGPFPNLILMTESGLRQGRSSFAAPHELGHILLDLPGHPDSDGPDTPTRLMDSDAAAPTVRGPKRLIPWECIRTLTESGPEATPPLLAPVAWEALVPPPPFPRAVFSYPATFAWPAAVSKRQNTRRPVAVPEAHPAPGDGTGKTGKTGNRNPEE